MPQRLKAQQWGDQHFAAQADVLQQAGLKEMMKWEHVARTKLAATTDRQLENPSEAVDSCRDGRHVETGEFLLVHQAGRSSRSVHVFSRAEGQGEEGFSTTWLRSLGFETTTER